MSTRDLIRIIALRAALKAIVVYATDKDDAKGIAAKALIEDEEKRGSNDSHSTDL